ncbi:hypothetical protein BT69DRAFT_1281875 [Atractiella rhizophila]|nr:hypothetical protein BT69DRAFT_1281875 [Atractiella rhizophila]
MSSGYHQHQHANPVPFAIPPSLSLTGHSYPPLPVPPSDSGHLSGSGVGVRIRSMEGTDGLWEKEVPAVFAPYGCSVVGARGGIRWSFDICNAWLSTLRQWAKWSIFHWQAELLCGRK